MAANSLLNFTPCRRGTGIDRFPTQFRTEGKKRRKILLLKEKISGAIVIDLRVKSNIVNSAFPNVPGSDHIIVNTA